MSRLLGAIENSTISRLPVSWPLAGAFAVVVFFTTFIGLGLILDYLLLPAKPEMVSFISGLPPMPKQSAAHSLISMLLGFAAARSSYAGLRGNDPIDALADAIVEFLKISVAYGVWLSTLIALVWVVNLGGFAGALGTALLVLFTIISFGIFLAVYEKNTPPYSNGNRSGSQ